VKSPIPSQADDGRRQAFSLVELVIVVVIIGIVAAIAVPRLSGAARSATAHSLAATLTNVRKAIDMYYAEHGKYPGYDPTTGNPDAGAFADQLLLYTSEQGKSNPTRTSPYIYGPYLRKPFPTNPFNNRNTVYVKAKRGDANPADGSVGWIAVLSTGAFGISATAADLESLAHEGEVAGLDVQGGTSEGGAAATKGG
jgi:prepilin-type N-terminal cleavage/methylation domain-containing protein